MSDAPLPHPGEEGQPLYVRLAHALRQRITGGTYPVGSLLPTEAEIGAAFSVSRHTVRQAIQHLRQQGLVSARKGVGTRVEAREPRPLYTQSLQSLAELQQYAHDTRLVVVSREEQAVRGESAALLGCRPGRRWLRVIGWRHAVGSTEPICWTEIYLDSTFSALAPAIGTVREALYSLIEERFGETIVEVRQEIAAVLLTPEQATLLHAELGAPALHLMRRYYAAGGRLLELSASVHPADRFTYAMTLRRDLNDQPAGPRR